MSTTEISTETQAFYRRLDASLDDLPETERRILVARFGLDGGGCRSLYETAQEVNADFFTVQSIEHRALNRLLT